MTFDGAAHRVQQEAALDLPSPGHDLDLYALAVVDQQHQQPGPRGWRFCSRSPTGECPRLLGALLVDPPHRFTCTLWKMPQGKGVWPPRTTRTPPQDPHLVLLVRPGACRLPPDQGGDVHHGPAVRSRAQMSMASRICSSSSTSLSGTRR